MVDFSYEAAFSRNLGWLLPQEQEVLHNLHVGIVGLGGVGGQYAEALARLGVGNFTIYDGDTFSIENSNRQNECRVSNYGKNKAIVIRDLILDINPQARVYAYNHHLAADQVEDFCQRIDIYVDSLDFFEVNIRTQIFNTMQKLGKPALTAAPLGTGSACVVFTKDSMSFNDYFGFHTTQDYIERSLLFLAAVSPTLQQKRYLQDRTYADFKNRKAPSLALGVYSCASLASSTLLKIVLKRGRVPVAPTAFHYDPYLLTMKKTRTWLGYRNPLQKLKIFFMRKLMKL